MKLLVNSDLAYAEALATLGREYLTNHYLMLDIKTGKQRTPTQNAALHVYCGLLADALSDAGYDRKVTTPIGQVSMPWTKDAVKENIWRPIQIALTNEQSTTAPLRKQYADIYDVIHRHMIETKGISVQWPVKKDGE